MQEKVKDGTSSEFNWVGTRPVRPDGVDKVTGRAKFGADLSMQGQLVGRVLRSPHPHARVRSIDTAAAAKLPGRRSGTAMLKSPPRKRFFSRVCQRLRHSHDRTDRLRTAVRPC